LVGVIAPAPHENLPIWKLQEGARVFYGEIHIKEYSVSYGVNTGKLIIAGGISVVAAGHPDAPLRIQEALHVVFYEDRRREKGKGGGVEAVDFRI
jgi:hypothetical protein